MDLVTAIKSGKPFRRRNWDIDCGFVIVDEYRMFAWSDQFNNAGQHEDCFLTPDDVCATDWDIQGIEMQ